MDDPDVLAFCIDKLRAGKVMFAIDYPHEDSMTATKFLVGALLTDEQRALVSHVNEERLFRLDPETS